MSGIEVIGLILGVIPVLFSAVDSYKKTISKSTVAFRKRKYVEKLARALLFQQQIIEETLHSILRTSGCVEELRLGDDPLSYFNDEEYREQVEEFLGSKNYAALGGSLDSSYEIIKKIACNIAGLLPEYTGPTDDLLGVIQANTNRDNGRWDLLPRVKLMFGIDELKGAIKELDDISNILDRFTRVVLANRQPTNSNQSSRKSENLAKGLRHVRGVAGNLYTAIIRNWKADCHNQHEARLFLEDRVDTAPLILRKIGKPSSTPILDFRLVFSAGPMLGDRWWYETVVQVYPEDKRDTDFAPSLYSRASSVTLVTPSVIHAKPKVTLLEDICTVIEAATPGHEQVVFVLTDDQQIGTAWCEEKTSTFCDQSGTITLEGLLASAHNLPLRGRMLLALRLASNLLQLLQTQWMQDSWSKSAIHFPLKSAQSSSNTSCHDPVHVDVSQPFVSLTVDGTSDHALPGGAPEPKAALLDLGILLLEIWHQKGLETQFSLSGAPVSYYQRLALAVEWLDDTMDPLPDLYEKAVSRCIGRFIGGESQSASWDDAKLWAGLCEDIIEPLSKNCKQWR